MHMMNAFMSQTDTQSCRVRRDPGTKRSSKELVGRRYENRDCKSYIDLREMLDRPDIDAVLIATGDNGHSLASILAARAGKDIYCEKPLSVTISESRAVADTMRRLGRVFQCGTQRRSIGNFRFAVHSGKKRQTRSPEGIAGRTVRVFSESVRYHPPFRTGTAQRGVRLESMARSRGMAAVQQGICHAAVLECPFGFQWRIGHGMGKPYRRPLSVGK